MSKKALRTVESELIKFFKNAVHKNCLCDITLTNGNVVTEVYNDINPKTIKVFIYEPNTGKSYDSKLSSLSTEDQLTIFKVVTKK